MPERNANPRIDRPNEGFANSRLPGFADRPVRSYVPADYQPLYPYPLVVLFHGDDGDEEHASRLAPRLSRRNFIALCLRGSRSAGRRDDGRPTFRWDTSSAAAARETEYLLAAIDHARQKYHVHSERVFLAGANEGADAALCLGLGLGTRIGGIVALNGRIPDSAGGTQFRIDAAHRLPVLLGHGRSNPIVPYATAKRDLRMLSAAGADVRLLSYPTTQCLHPNMLRDTNRWIIARVLENKAASDLDW